MQQLEARWALQAPYAGKVTRQPAVAAGDLIRSIGRGLPLLLTEVLGDTWRASMAELGQRYGHLPLLPLAAEILGATTNFSTLGSLLAAVQDEQIEAVYSGGCALPGPIHDAFACPLLPPHCFTRPQLWLGRCRGRSCTRLHRDFLHAFIGQVSGTKTLRPYPPYLLYPGTCFDMFELARVDLFFPDFAAHPRAATATPIEIRLQAGELLVLPAGWFHAVATEQAVMSVNRFLRDEAWLARIFHEVAPELPQNPLPVRTAPGSNGNPNGTGGRRGCSAAMAGRLPCAVLASRRRYWLCAAHAIRLSTRLRSSRVPREISGLALEQRVRLAEAAPGMD